MTDIVQRLRDWPRMTPVACKEAADEIERLRAELQRLHGVLTKWSDANIQLLEDLDRATRNRGARVAT